MSRPAALLLLLALAPFGAWANSHPPRAEAQLRQVLDKLAQGRLSDALGEADRLVATYPNFRLAHVLRGDLLLARAQPIAGFGDGAPGARERLEELRAEAAARLVSAFLDPGPQPLMVVTFDQDYRSSNLSQKARKRQYWVQEAGRWKIAYEGAIGRPVLRLPESFPRAGSGDAASRDRS